MIMELKKYGASNGATEDFNKNLSMNGLNLMLMLSETFII